MHFLPRHIIAVLGGVILSLCFSISATGQGKAAPTTRVASAKNAALVKRIDFAGLRKALTPSNKPLLVNFWATWCDPCREEFPDLVKLDAEYKGRIDFITISLDEL